MWFSAAGALWFAVDSVTHYEFTCTVVALPVTGASISNMVRSWRRMAAPSSMMRRATASSSRPSLVRWAFSRSTRGRPSASNTSFMVSRWARGKGTAEGGGRKDMLERRFHFCERWFVKTMGNAETRCVYKNADNWYLCLPIYVCVCSAVMSLCLSASVLQ